jgi:hypothetical protein
MPTLPRPFIRRSADLPPVKPSGPDRSPLPRQRPVPAANGRAGVPAVSTKNVTGSSMQSAKAPRKTFADRLFPVRPGMTEPSWSRVLGLIVFMTLLWELLSYGAAYFAGINFFTGPVDPVHDQALAWHATLQTLPGALLLSSVGSVPGFWMMRSRIRRSNALIAQERAAQRAAAMPRAGQGTSNRARRRRAGKQGGRR